MPGLALLLLALYGLLAVGLRMLVQLWKTGSTGFKGLSGAPGSAEWTGGLMFAVGIGLAVAGAELDQTDALEPIGALDGEIGRVAGVGLALGGMVATVGAQLAMGEAWRIGVDQSERTQLVTDGPFSVVRNPIYTCMIAFFVGIALLSPTAVTVAGALLVTVALELQTRLVEEPYLLRLHGGAYADYAARVGRFIPWVGRLRR